MHKIIVSIVGAAAFLGLSVLAPARLGAQGTANPTAAGGAPPDFSGVYYPAQAGSGGQQPTVAAPSTAQRGAPPRPTASAPVSDGRQGRSPDAPWVIPAERLTSWNRFPGFAPI